MTVTKRLLSALILLLAPQWGAANDAPVDTRSNPSIERAVIKHIDHLLEASIRHNGWKAQNKTITVTLPKGSHRLAPCTTPMKITRRDKRLYPAGRLRFSVQCHDSTPWSINVQAAADVMVPMAYATRTLAKEALIQPDDIELKLTHLASVNRDFIALPEQVIGQRVLRQTRKGQRLSPVRVSSAYLIVKGDSLIIEAVGDAFSASMSGTAIESGFLDEQIRVRNNSSGKTIRAVIIDSGKVQTLF